MSGVDLVQWLRDQLDEDADLVARNSDGHGLSEGFPDYRTYDGPELEAADEYIDVFGPARVLREINAKRRKLVRCEEAMLSASPMLVHFAKQTVREMALPYSGRPDYEATLAAFQ